jgi:hypothetical protein
LGQSGKYSKKDVEMHVIFDKLCLDHSKKLQISLFQQEEMPNPAYFPQIHLIFFQFLFNICRTKIRLPQESDNRTTIPK